MWPLTPKATAISLAVVAALASGAGGWLGFSLGKGTQLAATLALQKDLTDSETNRANGWQAALKVYGEANQKAQDALAETARLKTRAGEERQRYERQRQENPSCAAQDAQPLLCQPW